MHVVVVGGGIIGLAIAHRLATRGDLVTLLEKEPTLAAHQTGRNSGVIHSGLYYPPGSLKARLCTAGARSMVEFARTYDLPHEVTGKLVVATDRSELSRLEALHARGVANGVPVTMLDATQAREVEPHVSGVAALHVHSTGIVDYAAVTRTLARLTTDAGAVVHTDTEVTSIETDADGVTVRTAEADLRADALVGCAGLHADRVARLGGLTPQAQIVPFRGEYYELRPDARHLVRNLVYPVPDPRFPFLGVHLTRMTDGTVHAGPNAVLALAREGYRWRDVSLADARETLGYPGMRRLARRFGTTGVVEMARSLSKRRFAASVARLLPEITSADLVRAAAGVRAQAVRADGTLVDDFWIEQSPRQVHVLNAPSPAATSALEIATHVVTVLDRGSAAGR